MTKKCCPHPFETIQILSSGDVIPCWCADFTQYSFGNIFEQSFDEIWNGEAAKYFRKDILEGKYTYCKTDLCTFNSKKFQNDTNENLIADYPLFVHFCADTVCNVKCITCRKKSYKTSLEFTKKLDDMIEPVFLPILKNAKCVYTSGSGEALASAHSQKLIKRIAQVYPEIQFSLFTNGILCNEKKLNELGILNRLYNISLSLPASTKKTYDKIVLNGEFQTVVENLIWLAKQKQLGLIRNVSIIFVLQLLNYKEMKSVVNFAKKIGIPCIIWDVKNRGESGISDNFKKYSITDKSHHKYNALVKELKNPVFKSPNCLLPDNLLNLKPISFYEKIKMLVIRQQD